MSKALMVIMPGNELFGSHLSSAMDAEIAGLENRRFPDGESYVRFETAPQDRDIIILCTLDRPDDKVLPLLFAAHTARDLGARSVGLVCPYLAYMRQDRRFKPGEAVTSRQFASVLSAHFDWLVTVDPHLHRHTSLSQIYSIPAVAVHAAPLIATWIGSSVERPVLIGPDAESEQWVAAIAQQVGAPHTVLTKVRRGDRDVEVSVPDLVRWGGHTPVLIDDIVSTARTMIAALRHLVAGGTRRVDCIAVHGIFAGNAYRDLMRAGASRIVTCNTIAHESNAIDVTDAVAEALLHAAQNRSGLRAE
jgi:ribose-phosphate pyrophosphokinase